MTWREGEIGRRVEGRIELRPEAVRLHFRLPEIGTADTHRIEVNFKCAVRALDERGEREMFAETFLASRDSVTDVCIGEQFSSALHNALRAVARQQPAEHWLAEANRPAIVEALRAAAMPLAFGCGVELLPPFEVIVTSPTVQREQIDALEQKLSARRHAGQVENVQRASELLKEFSALRQAMPDLSAGRLLQQVASRNQGSMLQALLLASSGDATARLFAVAGPNLLSIDPRTMPAKIDVIALPTDLGPLRSVQSDGDRLLIGAQRGVMIVDPKNPNGATKFIDPAITSQLGFNSVARASNIIWATHGDAGVVAWEIDRPTEPRLVLRNFAQAKNVVALDDRRMIFTASAGVFVADVEKPPALIAPLKEAAVFVHVEPETVQIAHCAGELEALDRQTFQRRRLHRRTGRLSAAAALPWLGTYRLLLASEDGAIHCLGGDDPLVTQYLSPHRGLRAVAATTDIIAALSADRQRIVLWNTWSGDSPTAEIHVAAIARHRAADICFG